MAKHYVSSLDDEAEEGDATKNRYIQEAYVANLAESNDFNMWLIQYNMKCIFIMSSLKEGIDPTKQKNPRDLWDVGIETDMIDSWERKAPHCFDAVQSRRKRSSPLGGDKTSADPVGVFEGMTASHLR